MTDFLCRAQALAETLAALRHALHRTPEPGNGEFQTAALIEASLRGWGLETRRVTETAIIATLRGGRPGKCVALRADMDALPIAEETGAVFSSQTPGWMHACGHDVHITAALGAAALLAAQRDALCGCVRFFFQPDEERNGGAARMIAAGCMDGVDAVFGGHVSPELPAGSAGFRPGPFYAASNPFDIAVIGKSAHGAEPEKGVDALYAAAKLAASFKQLQAPLTARNGRTVLSVCSLHSGTACNILAGRAELSGMLRTLDPDSRANAVQAMRDTLDAVAAKTGVRIEADIRTGYPGVSNDGAMTALAEQAARSLLGADRVIRIAEPTMTTEDFGYFLQKAPGSFYWLGVGGEAALHTPQFLPDDSVLPTAAALHASVLWAALSHLNQS